MLRDNIRGIIKPANSHPVPWRCHAHLGPCGALEVFLENVTRDAFTYTEHANECGGAEAFAEHRNALRNVLVFERGDLRLL
ncbi:hypothetical protein NDU88_001218 [Pleurodeles waltl]|uniref:Uncharacterized protein n=1 Tax=Pleurodeles waltl TaxID=8319 RepID=A0AAV7V785_PLEWA|nr:hypothetical protein NDU88_001218 [Pleurodeles waltl]